MESLGVTFFSRRTKLDKKCSWGILLFCVKIGGKFFIMNADNSFFSNNKKFSFVLPDQFFLMVLIIFKFLV